MAKTPRIKSRSTDSAVANRTPTPSLVRDLLSADDCPALNQALDGPDGERLGLELERLFGERMKVRAERRYVKRIARLQCGEYDEVVMLKDISATGVRLLVRGDQPLDVRHMLEMRLTVQLPERRCVVPVSLVRVCGKDGEHIDLGCRFLTAASDSDQMVGQIRNYIFSIDGD